MLARQKNCIQKLMITILQAPSKGTIRFEIDDQSPDAVEVSGHALDFIVADIYEGLVGAPMGSADGYRLESASGQLQIVLSGSTLTEGEIEYHYYGLTGRLDRDTARQVYKRLVAIGLARESPKDACLGNREPPYEDQYDEADYAPLDEDEFFRPYDESEDPDFDSIPEGDLDNYWNEPGRLESAVNELHDMIE